MRAAVAFLAALTLAAADRGGCVPPAPPAADAGCAGLACGEPCAYCPEGATQCPVPTFAPTACTPRGACVTVNTFSCDLSVCDGKKCGDACTIDPTCRAATPPCMMPSLAGFCDAEGQCTTTPPACAPYDPCAGKKCGDTCDACAPGQPCPMTAVVTACDRTGACVPQTSGMCDEPVTDCTGQVCGTPCVHPWCTPDTTCAPPTTPLACNGNQQCDEVRSWSCYVPCEGKSCGDSCHICPPRSYPYPPGESCGETTVLRLCDASGICVMAGPEVVCK
jgi:hypothetical protein